MYLKCAAMAFMPRPPPVILTITCVAPGATVLRIRLRTSWGDITEAIAATVVNSGSLPPPPPPFPLGMG
jgi:hypothetical protein